MATETTTNNSKKSTFRQRLSLTRSNSSTNGSSRSVGEGGEEPKSKGVFQRLRDASRSRSRSRARNDSSMSEKPILVAITSCRSDAYYNQKAPGSTSKLPRKAPSNLKLFHELAVGIKDAYAAVNQTPERPEDTDELLHGKKALWEFFGNLDFVSIIRFLSISHNSILYLSHLDAAPCFGG